MKTKGKQARNLFEQGYNCAQSVFGAFAEEIGLDFETALMISSPFGAGMGRMREVCGAVSGMMLVAGMLYGNSDPKNTKKKAEIYKLVRELAQQFKDNNGSIICKELLNISKPEESWIPNERTEDYYKKRPCSELVEMAGNIIGDYIENKTSKEICES